ncbi:MAG: hypothetical protein ACRC5A_12340 [Enterobacteriaceae bacterium]
MKDREFERLKEQVQQLTGERGDSSRAAIRRGDIPPVTLNSRPVTEVTPEAFNQLLTDINLLVNTLNALRNLQVNKLFS